MALTKSAISFCSGLHFSDIDKMCQVADIQWMSKTLFYDYQHSHILPVIDKNLTDTLKSSRDLIIQKGNLL